VIKTFRKDEIVQEDLKIESLKIHNKETSTVKEGLECGLRLKNYNDFEPGDDIKFFKKIKIDKTFNYTPGIIKY